MAGAAPAEHRAMGIWLKPEAHAEAERIAAVVGLRKSQVIRLAIEAGLPLLRERFGCAQGTGSTAS